MSKEQNDHTSESLVIYRKKLSGTLYLVTVEVNEENTLIVGNYDLGKAPMNMFGKIDFETNACISPKFTHKVLVHLIKEKFNNNINATTAFMRWLDKRKIPYNFSCY